MLDAGNIRILNLGQRSGESTWTDFLGSKDPGIHVLLTHEGYLENLLLDPSFREEILGEGASVCRMPKDMSDERGGLEASFHLISPFGLSCDSYVSGLTAYMGKLRQQFFNSGSSSAHATDKENRLVSLARADFWSIAFQPEVSSPFLAIGGILHTYLLWNKGGGWEEEGNGYWACHAWRGSGWVEPFVDCGAKNNLPFSEDLSDRLKANLYRLARQYPCNETEQSVDQRKHDLLRTLCSYLPRVNDGKEWRTPFPNTPDEPGAPKHFHDLASLGRLERMLLLDGWLTPWQYQDEWYVQPGSLALLYWAARELKYAHTASPERFIERYDWSAPGWFGGHLRQKRKK